MKDLFLLIAVLFTGILATPFVIAKAQEMGRTLAWNSASAVDVGNSLLLYNALLAESARRNEPAAADGDFHHNRITAHNASLFDQSHFSEELTSYATGYRDPSNIEETLAFIAPEVPSPRKPEYAKFGSAQEFLSDGASDDLRAIGANFATVQYTSEKEIGKLLNRGLAIDIDFDEVDEMPGWERRYTEKLLRRLHRNSLRRAIALLGAAAVNTNVTWSTADGTNPDGNVRSELILASNQSGIRPNRIFYGDTAFDLRVSAHEAQDNAGGHAAAGRTPEQLAAYLNVDGVRVSHERFATDPSDAALQQIMANLVLMFAAYEGADLEDPSNIKRLVGNVGPNSGGGRYGVLLREVGDKQYRLAVEHYELIIVPAALGIRQFTVSGS